MKNIKENNVLIAKFIGYSQPHPDYPNTTYWYKDGEEPLAILLFHVDWNWLMKCVKEIQDVDVEFKFKHLGAFVSWEHRFKESLFIGIDNTYRTVVEFIEWYNKNK